MSQSIVTDGGCSSTTSSALDGAHGSSIDSGSSLVCGSAGTGVLDVLIMVAKHKRLVIGLPIVAACIGLITTLFMTPVYTASTKILPPQQQSTAAAMIGQLGVLTGGASGLLSIKNPADLYAGMLKSRTIADGLINEYRLLDRYHLQLLSDARDVLEKNSKISIGKDGIITIEVDDIDPEMAAKIANGYVNQLLKLTSVLAITEAGQRRIFFEKQLASTKNSLLTAEIAARRALNRGGVATVDAQGRALVETSGALRAQIASKEVQLGSMKSFATDRNPEYLKAFRELRALQEQLAKIEGNAAGSNSNSKRTSEAGLENLALLRDVKYYEVLFDLLTRQYELAKIDEAREGAVIQVVDVAATPDKKSRPKRLLIAILTALFAVCFAVLAVLIIETRRGDPIRAKQIALLRKYIGV